MPLSKLKEGDKMNHKQRLLMAVNHQEPDRVPIDVWYTPEMKQKMTYYLVNEGRLNKSGTENKGEPDPVFLDLDHDMLITTIGPCSGYYLEDSNYYTDEWGIGFRKVEYQEGSYYTEPVDHPLKDLKDPNEISIPDFTKEERYRIAKYLIQHYGNTHAIVAEVACTLFELSWYLRGMKRVMMDFRQNKDFMHAYLNELKEWVRIAGTRLVEMGVDVIFMGDDFGMQDRMLVSPETFREFFKPIYANLFANFKKINPKVKIAFHTDGNVKPILPDFIEIGLDILNPVQPQAMNPAELKKKFGDKLTFWGAIDNQYTMPFGNVQEVIDEVKSRLKKVAPGGGLIIGPSHNVQPNTPIENMMAFYETVKKHGKYPISIY